MFNPKTSRHDAWTVAQPTVRKEQIIANRKSGKIVFRCSNIARTQKAWDDLGRAKVLSWYEVPAETNSGSRNVEKTLDTTNTVIAK